MSLKKLLWLAVSAIVLLARPVYAAESVPQIKPYMLLAKAPSTIETVTPRLRVRLQNANFRIVGEYAPYPGAYLIAVTSDYLLAAARKSKYGGMGAVMKIGLVQVGKDVQVMANNPEYFGIAYHMKDNLATVKKSLQSIGFIKDFGGKGLSKKALKDYNYTFGLEKFSDFYELATHSSYSDAVEKVEAGLRKRYMGISKVYRVDIPGKQQTVFGISLNSDVKAHPFMNDKYLMDIMDFRPLKRLPYLPYEILVNGKQVLAPHAHFRLAVYFPDLPMFGIHGFGRLMDLPYQFEEFFTKLVGGVWPPPSDEY
jgi:hypothetical protein